MLKLKLDASCLARSGGIGPLLTIHVQHKQYTTYGNNFSSNAYCNKL
jgi:hypothetical protein